jgi:hypothetical protein
VGAQYFPQIITPRSIVDGPTLTTAARASCIPTNSKFTLPNNYWELGKQWRLRAYGRISCAVTTPGTARFDLSIGGVVAFDTLAMNLNTVSKVNVHWALDVLLTCRAIGNGVLTTLFGQGTWESEAVIASPVPTAGGSGQFLVPYNTAPVIPVSGFDNTTANIVDFFFTQTVATGSMTLHQFMIEEMN